MKTEIKMLVLEMHPVDHEPISGVGEREESPSYELQIPIEEIVSFLGDIKWDNFKLVKVKGVESVDVYTEDEIEDLETEIEELKDKLDNACNYIDNIEEHLNDLRDNISYALGDLDEAEEDTQYAKDECEHEWYRQIHSLFISNLFKSTYSTLHNPRC